MKKIIFFFLLASSMLINDFLFASKMGILTLPGGKKMYVDLTLPIYITRKINGKVKMWIYNPQTKLEKPIKYTVNPKRFNEIIAKASQVYGVNPKLIHSVIRHESNYNPRAVSPAGAMGLMQLIPGTAKRMGVQDAFDPYQNIMGGTKYLRLLLDMFKGNPINAIAAYNAGEHRVIKYGGVPPFPETKQYVKRVINDFWYN